MALLLCLRVIDPRPIEELRLRVFDFFQVLSPRIPTERPVVIVDIDEASIEKFGQWPWPRTRIADLITALSKLDVISTAFDVVFSEPDRVSPQLASEMLRGLDEETRAKLRLLPDNDELMAQAMRTTKVILGESGLPTIQQSQNAPAAPYGVASLGNDPKPFLLSFPGLLRNIPMLEKAAAGHGLFSIRPESDGIVRRVPVVMLAQGRIVPSLTFEVLRVATGSPTMLIRTDESGVKSIRIPGFEMPTDSHAQIWIYFARHDRSLYVSVADIIDGRVPREKIAGKIALVGSSAVSLSDLKTTASEPALPGVEVHAQVLESILSNSILTLPNYALPLELIVAAILGLVAITIVPWLGARNLFAFGAAFSLLLPAASWYAFKQNRLLIDFTFPLLSTVLIYLLLLFRNYLQEQTQRQRIRSAFGQYLAPVLVEQLAQQPDKLVLGGERREMTILFSDLRGFTTLSEHFKDDPQSLIALMNGFLTPLTNAIIENSGTIDKYMGDAIMAFWNAPLYDSGHEAHACQAALEMMSRLDRLNREREEQAKNSGAKFIPLEIGIGINTGPCVVGNMGSNLRFDYSVLGDSVNLASRLQGQCKSYGVPIIVGEATARALADKSTIVELDFVAVKGKSEAQLIYAVVGGHNSATSASFKSWQGIHKEMLGHYRKREWELALSAIERSRAADEGCRFETLRELYAERIKRFQVDPPPADWDGSYSLETK